MPASTDPPHLAGRSLPTGTVTFLFSDIVGSTRMWETRHEAMQEALAQHDALLREAISSNGGHLIKTTGDGVFAAFAVASNAIAAGIAAQRALRRGPWGDLKISSRMAVHSGAVEERDGDYHGTAINRASRLMDAGHGGQILLSLATEELVRDHLPPSVTLRDMGEQRLKDLIRPEHVYQVVAPDLPSDFAPLRTLDAHPNNLPQQLTSFIGRDKEIGDLKALLTRGRLLTVTGSGGSGKTRLCLQVAADTLERFGDGVYFVELAALADPALAAQTAATVLGVKEEAGKPILQTLTEQLKKKQLLLLLDNCEHLRDACAKLANALLLHCPGVHVLASSREALGIAGEQSYRVPSLTLPDRREQQTPLTLSQYESVRLFIDRALSVRPDFHVTNQNAPALASLCCHLDGIPLAIELAAARVRSLSVEEIDGKLDQRFRLLTGGSRTALPRQQTLRSLIDWSYDLLQDPEKRLLQRLSVFAGGWTYESAERVCAGEGVDEGEVLDLLTSLSDKSLAVSEESGGRSRYRLLETVRQYARERLVESGGGEAIRERHRDCFLALAEEAEPKLLGAEQAAWLQRLEDEHENLRAALNWSLAEPGTGGLRCCAALQRFWWTRGHIAEGREWCRRALNHAGAEARTAERAKVLNAAGLLANYQADYAAAWAQHQESLAIRRELGDRHGIASSLNNLGNVTLDQGDLSAARALYEESLAIMREVGQGSGIAPVLNNVAGIAYEQGDYPKARALHEESLAICRGLGDRIGVARSLNNLGRVAHARRDYAAAAKLYAEALGILRALDDHRGMAISLEGLAAVRTARGEHAAAARIWSSAERLREEIGSPLASSARLRYREDIDAARAALADDAAFDSAWREGSAQTLDRAIDFALQTSERA